MAPGTNDPWSQKICETEHYKKHTSMSPQIPDRKTAFEENHIATFITEMCHQRRKAILCESPEMVVEHLPKYLFP